MILRNSNRCQKKYLCTLEETKAMGQKRGIKFEKRKYKTRKKMSFISKIYSIDLSRYCGI